MSRKKRAYGHPAETDPLSLLLQRLKAGDLSKMGLISPHPMHSNLSQLYGKEQEKLPSFCTILWGESPLQDPPPPSKALTSHDSFHQLHCKQLLLRPSNIEPLVGRSFT